MTAPLSRVEVRDERDVVLARQRARAVAARLGFEAQDQARISAAVSEVARNAVHHAGSGFVEFFLEGEVGQSLAVRISDSGPGFDRDLAPGLDSPIGRGLDGARKMMDEFRIEPSTGPGAVIVMSKTLPRRLPSLGSVAIAQVVDDLAQLVPPSPVDELLRQNRDMIRALDDLRAREVELARLNRELADTNRGVMALYLETRLQRAESLKPGQRDEDPVPLQRQPRTPDAACPRSSASPESSSTGQVGRRAQRSSRSGQVSASSSGPRRT